VALIGKPIYTGRFRHTLDDKNRLTIPSAWRATHAETDQFLATANPDGHIVVLPPADLEKLYEKTSQQAMSDRDQAGLDYFFSMALSFNFDKQGRFALSDDLRLHAGLDKDVILVGSLNKFSIYSPARWEKVTQKVAGELGESMRRIGI